MTSIRFLTVLAAGLLLSANAVAQPPQVAIESPWVRASVPQQQATGAFMRLTARTDLRLVAARSDVAAATEVHEMAMQGQMMRMRQVPSVALPRGRTVALAPGGYHIMLIGLKRPLGAGEQVPLTLVFEDAAGRRSEVGVQAPVRPLGAGAP